MRFPIRAGLAAISLVLIFPASLVGGRDVSAAGEQPPGPDRYAVISQEFMKYAWWLARWSASYIACQIEIEHDGLPRDGEVYDACGQPLYDEWIATPSCEASSTDPGTCSGYYLHFVKAEAASRQVPAQLPPPVVWVTLDGCIPYASTHRCDASPTLVLTGEEPVSGYSILRLEGTVEDTPFTCDPICQVDLGPTDEDGLLIRFWAYSSYGDSSETFEARVRVRNTDDPQDPYWYVDVLTTQWRGAAQAPCMQTWNTYPPVGGLTGWLASPDTAIELASSIPFEYLAGNLISHSVVDASVCSDGGLLENGYASVCGLEVARAAVDEWQNRFDGLIISAAQETGIPAQLLKNIFSRESQFWPGVTSGRSEAGLGQMTENGADTMFLWNIPFYEQFCPTVLDPKVCANKVYPDLEEEWDYMELSEVERSLLRAALVSSVNAHCSDCPLGIDLERAEFSVSVFAEMLLANCAQTGMVLDLNYTDDDFIPAYEDLWRFTLVNYNAGAGCLGLAVNETSASGEPLDWEHVSSHLTPACRGAQEYVEDVSR
ncbi:MAG: hypothetical protein HY781_13815 [Chloroflexi bacterium]|nr:hypothetical protein [Chloroflexota bacterium]